MLEQTRLVDLKQVRNQLFIDGEFVDAQDGATISV